MRLARPSPITLLCGGLALVYAARTLEYFAGADGLMDKFGYVIGRDFIAVWLAAKLTLGGQIAAVFDPALYRQAMVAQFGPDLTRHLWLYPPHYLLLILPYGILGYVASLVLWAASTFVLYAGAALTGLTRHWQAGLVLFLAPATYANLLFGQNGFITAALLIGGLRLLQTHPVLAGVCFGVLTVKPQLGLLIPVALVALGAWRTIASAAITGIALMGLSAVVFGVDSWLAFAEVTTGQQSLLLNTPSTGLHLLMVTPFGAAIRLGGPVELALALNLATAALAAIAVWWSYRRPAEPVLRHAVLVTAVYFAAPYSLTYDMPALAAMCVWLWLAAPGFCRPVRTRLALLAVWMLPLLHHLAMIYYVPLAPLVLAGFGALLLSAVARSGNR
ncbi:MAG: glycosyltransferase family 87 protein [Alphaproteobacteria bacterium]